MIAYIIWGNAHMHSRVPSPKSHVPRPTSQVSVRFAGIIEMRLSLDRWLFGSFDLWIFSASVRRILGSLVASRFAVKWWSCRAGEDPPPFVAVAHNFMGAASANTLAKFMHIPADPPLPIALPSQSIVNLHTERRNFATYLLANLSYPFSDENVGKIWWADYAANRCEDCYAAASINN